MSGSVAGLLLESLRLAPPSDPPRLARRWASAEVAARAGGIAAWIVWERAEQWLLRRLADCGALAAAPSALVAVLQQAARRDAKAGLAVDADAADALRAIAALGVPCVLLKGPARRASADQLPLADARLTRDVDVLVPAAESERLWWHFRSRGYLPYEYDPARLPPGESEVQGPSPYHLRALLRPGGATLELHVTTERGLSPARAWDRLWSGARIVRWQGMDVRVPSFTELLWQALTHADVAGSTGWSLRHWLDAASVIAAQPVDWAEVAARIDGGAAGARALALAWLSGAFDLAAIEVPPEVRVPHPPSLEEMAAWRLAVLARPARPVDWRDKLLDEGTRSSAGLPLAPLVGGRSWPVHLRRRAASLAARSAHLAWRYSRRGG